MSLLHDTNAKVKVNANNANAKANRRTNAKANARTNTKASGKASG